MKGIVYCYNINGKFYVGKTYRQERKRWEKHKHDALTNKANTPFARAIRKYGWDKVFSSYEVLETIEHEDVRELNKMLIERENFYIDKKNSILPHGYNVKKSNTIHIPTQNNKEEMYKKISKSLKGKYMNQDYSSKKIICLETNKEYPSISECAREMGITVACICRVLKKKQVTAGNFTFMYVGGELPRKSLQKRPVRCIGLDMIFDSLKDASEYFTGKRNQHCNVASAIKRNGTFKGHKFEFVTR